MQNTFIGKLRRLGILAALLGIVAWVGVGCEGGGGDDKDAFVGVWKVTKNDSGSVGYYHFNSDGTFYKTRETIDGAVHFSGTYTVSGGTLTGQFTSPGVGEGEIVATISGGVMSLDFIEHWTNPWKHTACTGTKVQ